MKTRLGSRIFYRRAFGDYSQRHVLQRSQRGVTEMRKLAFGALFVGLVAIVAVACGGSDNNTKKVKLIDSGSGSGSDVCNVLTQTGCDTGQMCTWIVDMADMTSSVGHIGCAPAGTKATDA